MKTLNEIAKEINNDWTSEYTAFVQDNELRVRHDHMVIAIVDEKLDVEMLEDGFDDVLDQLTYMAMP